MRDKNVSLAKGIAIALVVLIHSIPPGFTAGFFGMFAVSSFFFMSGYCFKDKYLDDTLAFVKICQTRMVDSLSNCRRSHTCCLDLLLSPIQG